MTSRFGNMQGAGDENARQSLKEKLKQHYATTRDQQFTLKKATAHRFGVPYFIICLIAHCRVGAWYVIPKVSTDDSTHWMWKSLFILIFFECFFNWSQVCRKYVNKVEKRECDEQRTDTVGWLYCAVCQAPAPPRSFHCKLCQACILRQGHHCFFAAGCTGFHTTGNFLFLSLWLTISQLLSIYWWSYYVLTMIPNIFTLFPVVSIFYAFVGTITCFDAFITILYVLMPVNLAVSVFYLFMEILSATGNLTMYEGSKGIRRYNQGSLLANIRATIGPYYWIRWLIPFYAAPTAGDGYDYNVRKSR